MSISKEKEVKTSLMEINENEIFMNERRVLKYVRMC